MEVFKNSNVVLSYDTQEKILVQKWVGFVRSEDFKAAIDKTVEFVRQNKVKWLISDTLEQRVVDPKDVSYAAAKMPTLVRDGLHAMAFVMPKNAITKFSLKQFQKESSSFKVNVFENLLQAKMWIKQQA